MFFSFDKGQDEPDTIGPEGVEKLCKDLGVDPEDVRTFFALSPHPLLPLVLMPLSVCLSFFSVLLMHGFLFHFCNTKSAICLALYKVRS